LGWWRCDLGYLLFAANRMEAAAKEHRQVIALLTQVNTQASTLPGYQRGRLPGFPDESVHELLAEAHLQLSRALRELGQSKGAESNLNQSLSFFTKVVQDWPGEPRHRLKLGGVELDLGRLLFDERRRREAFNVANGPWTKRWRPPHRFLESNQQIGKIVVTV
jgi:hypothetical protein